VTLNGMVADVDAAKFMLPWLFSEKAPAEKHMAQLQHNMSPIPNQPCFRSTGGGKWVEIMIHADALYQHFLLTAERKFWRCVESGEHSGRSASSLPSQGLRRASRRAGHETSQRLPSEWPVLRSARRRRRIGWERR
jgi:hypothetical protein